MKLTVEVEKLVRKKTLFRLFWNEKDNVRHKATREDM